MMQKRFPVSPEMEVRRQLIEQSRLRVAKRLTVDDAMALEQLVEDGRAVEALTSQKGWAIVEEIIYQEMNFPSLASASGSDLVEVALRFQVVRRLANRIYDVISTGEEAAARLMKDAARQEEKENDRREENERTGR